MSYTYNALETPARPFIRETESFQDFLSVIHSMLSNSESLIPPDLRELMEAAKDFKVEEDPIYVKTDAGLSVGLLRYGKLYRGGAEIYAAAQATMLSVGYTEQVPNLTETSGFDRLFHLVAGLSPESYLLLETLLLKHTLDKTLEAQGLTVADVDLVIAATSLPVVPNFHKKWRHAMGIANHVPVEAYCMACNSTGRAIADLMTGDDEKMRQDLKSYLQKYKPDYYTNGTPAVVAVLSLDDPTNRMDLGGDPLSVQVFGNGLSVTVFRYHQETGGTFSLINSVSKSREEGAEELRTLKPWESWTEEEQAEIRIARHLGLAPEGQLINMTPRAGAVFKRGVADIFPEALEAYLAKGGSIEKIKRAVIHHPSKTIFEKVKQYLVTFHRFKPEQIHWVISEGNIPVCTFAMALGRQMDELEIGDDLLFLTFGAGGEFTVNFANLQSVV